MNSSYSYRCARLLLALLLLTTSVLTACDSNSTPTPLPGPAQTTPTSQAFTSPSTSTPNLVPTQAVSDPSTPTTQASPNPPPATVTAAPPPPPTSLYKIEAAEQAGEIDHDTALLYTLYAYYDRDSLPTEYQGDDSTLIVEGMHVFGEITTRLDSMPAGVRAKAEPFLLRPDNPASFWNRPPSAQQPEGLSNPQPALARATPTLPAGWDKVDASNTNIRIWYPRPEDGPGLATLAADLAREIDASDMWNKEKRVMKGKEPCPDTTLAQNGGSPHFDVYLTLSDFPVPRGSAPGTPASLRPGFGGDFVIPQQSQGRGCPIAGFALLNSALQFKELKSYMAHELFHGFQSAMTVKVLDPQWYWWVESSATWAMDLVYPQVNYEHTFLELGEWARQEQLIGPLTCPNKPAHCNYGAYLWPFFLTRGGGGAIDEYIGTIWELSKDKKPIDVMSEMNGWSDLWKKFALWNWNEGPADLYRDPDEQGGTGHIAPLVQKAFDLGLGLPPNGSSNRFAPGEGLWPGAPLKLGEKKDATITLPPASFDYYLSGPPPGRAGVLHFEFAELTAKEGASVQAIITIGDPAKPDLRYYDDWSSKTEKKFCLDRPEEYATSVVVIVGNSNVRSGAPLEGKLSVTAKNETCPNRSSLNFTQGGSYAIHAPTSSQPGRVDGSMTTYEQVQSTWSLQFDQRQGDEVYYNFMSTNAIDLHASANLRGADPGTHSTVNATLNRSSTTHNPTQPADDGYGKKTRGTLGQQWQNFPQPTFPGRLVLTKFNGRDAYIMTLGVTPLVPQFNFQAIVTSACTDKTSTTHDYTYNNQTYTERTAESGDRKCFHSDGKPQQTAGPFNFGAITLDNSKPRGPTGSHNFIAGFYDPKTNVIEGYETYSTQVCREAYKLDPFVFFLGESENRLNIDFAPKDDPANATCNFHYTISWRVDLPKQP
jgi:hypothetical protein